MLHAVVTHAAHFDLSIRDGILNRLPAGQPGRLPSVWAVQEEQVDIAKAAGVDRLLDGLPDSVVGRVVIPQLRRVVDVLTGQPFGVLVAGQVICDSTASLPLVAVPLRRVKAAVARS